jgi:hypothetical protein
MCGDEDRADVKFSKDGNGGINSVIAVGETYIHNSEIWKLARCHGHGLFRIRRDSNDSEPGIAQRPLSHSAKKKIILDNKDASTVTRLKCAPVSRRFTS